MSTNSAHRVNKPSIINSEHLSLIGQIIDFALITLGPFCKVFGFIGWVISGITGRLTVCFGSGIGQNELEKKEQARGKQQELDNSTAAIMLVMSDVERTLDDTYVDSYVCNHAHVQDLRYKRALASNDILFNPKRYGISNRYLQDINSDFSKPRSKKDPNVILFPDPHKRRRRIKV